MKRTNPPRGGAGKPRSGDGRPRSGNGGDAKVHAETTAAPGSRSAPSAPRAKGAEAQTDRIVSPDSSMGNPKAEDLAPFREDPEGKTHTTNVGTPVQNDQDTLKAGARGPSLLEDFHFREKMTHFDHERIPERVVHAPGTGAHGYFQVNEDLSELTRAKFLCDPSLRTPVFVRSRPSSARAARPTSRATSAASRRVLHGGGQLRPGRQQHPGLLHPGRREVSRPDPRRQARAGQPDPAGRYRARHVLGLHLADARVDAHDHVGHVGSRDPAQLPHDGRLRRPHVPARQRGGRFPLRQVPLEAGPGRALVAWDEAQKISGKDPDFHRRDLWEAIEQGNYPEWELGLQVLEESQEHDFDFDLLDATKLIPEELVPVRRVGPAWC
jgi:catalase